MKILLFDIEGNDLLVGCTKVWCVVIKDYKTKEVWRYGPQHIQQAIQKLQEADRVVAHNGLGYDCPVLTRLFQCVLPICIDTLILSRLLFPDRFTHPVGGNSLGEWGTFLGCPKTQHTDWTKFTPQMMDYCQNDVNVLEKIYEWLVARIDKQWKQSIVLQHQVAKIITRQVQNGFTASRTKIQELIAATDPARKAIQEQLKTAFPPICQTMKTPQYYQTTYGVRFPTKKQAMAAGFRSSQIVAGPLRIKYHDFNPLSGKQIVQRLGYKYGWEPTKFKKDTGNPVVDGNVLQSLPYPQAKLLVEYRTVNTRADQAAKWLVMSQKTGKIHGSVNTIGAPTGRMSHSQPNINFPRVVKDKKTKVPKMGIEGGFGFQCRSCFGPRAGWREVGIDAASLQLRMLGNRLWKYDNGAYARIALEGDIHTVNMHAAGLDDRDQSKTFFYAFCYGAGPEKLGSIKKPLASPEQQRRVGLQLKAAFLKGIPAMGKLLEQIAFQAQKHKYMVGLDGRKVPVRSGHAALNTQLQCDGAVLMKKALVIFDKTLQEKYKGQYEFLANVHDQWQIECVPQLAGEIGRIGCDSISEAGRSLDLKVPMQGQFKVGNNWAECH